MRNTLPLLIRSKVEPAPWAEACDPDASAAAAPAAVAAPAAKIRRDSIDASLQFPAGPLHQMAGNAVAGGNLGEPRGFLLAARFGIGTARVEGAAGGRRDRARHVALQQFLGPLQFRV